LGKKNKKQKTLPRWKKIYQRSSTTYFYNTFQSALLPHPARTFPLTARTFSSNSSHFSLSPTEMHNPDIDQPQTSIDLSLLNFSSILAKGFDQYQAHDQWNDNNRY